MWTIFCRQAEGLPFTQKGGDTDLSKLYVTAFIALFKIKIIINIFEGTIWAIICTGNVNWIYRQRTIFEAACLSKDLYSMFTVHLYAQLKIEFLQPLKEFQFISQDLNPGLLALKVSALTTELSILVWNVSFMWSWILWT